MISDRIKNKIYALASISVIAFSVASFILTVNFLLKINNLVFKVDERLITDKSSVLDANAYNEIKDKLDKIN